MTRSRTPLTYRIVPQDMDSVLRRRDAAPQQRHHLDLVCTICNKRFNRKFDLNRHVALHLPKDEQRRHCCTWPGCTYSALQKTNLTTHINAVHLQMKNFKCRVENCQRAFSDAASKIRHEKNVHGVLPARKIVRNRSHLSDEELYESEGEDFDIVMDPGLSATSCSSPTPLDPCKEEEKPRCLKEVSPYTLVPSDYFGHQMRSTTASSSSTEIDASLPPPSPTPSNYTSISTVVTEASQNAVDGVVLGSDRAGEVPRHRKLLTAFTSRGRALSAPDISVSGLTRVLRHSHSPSPRQDPPPTKRRSEDADSSLAGQVESVADIASDPLDNAPKPVIRLPGIDDLLRGPTAPNYRHDAHKQQTSRHGARSPSKSRQPTSFTTSTAHEPRPRAFSVAPDEHSTYGRQGEFSSTQETRSRSNGTPPRRASTRPSIATHFSPYGSLAERQRLPIGRARAHSEVFAPNPVRPIGLERPPSHWRSDRNQENHTPDVDTDEQQRCGSPAGVFQPRRQSLDPLFGFLSRRPSTSASPLNPVPFAGLAGSTRLSGPIDRSTTDDVHGEMADKDQESARERSLPHGYFISTIMTNEPLSPTEGAKCRLLRSDGRILPAKLVNKRIALPDEQVQ